MTMIVSGCPSMSCCWSYGNSCATAVAIRATTSAARVPRQRFNFIFFLLQRSWMVMDPDTAVMLGTSDLQLRTSLRCDREGLREVRDEVCRVLEPYVEPHQRTRYTEVAGEPGLVTCQVP